MTPGEISGLLALSERLRATYLVRDEFSTCHPLCNPDGPEAADALDALHAKIAELEGERDALLAERDAASARMGELELLADVALGVLIQMEPGDSRAVSNEFVAMAAVRSGDANDECFDILGNARARLARGEG